MYIQLTPMRENAPATVIIDGRRYTRVVRFNKADGLYIVVNNRKYFEYEFEYFDWEY